MNLEAILQQVAAGQLSPVQAQEQLKQDGYRDLGFARIDTDRPRRRAFPEVIYCPNKTPAQVAAIVGTLKQAGQSVLATRADAATFAAVHAEHPDTIYHERARCITLADIADRPRIGKVAVVSAGTADIPVAEEAALTAEWAGAKVSRVFDCGVAGIHRLMPHLEMLRSAHAVVCVAGMEGALPSVLGGLIDRPLIAVPTSVGYGMNLGGIAALLAMLNSCAAGVTVVNIDNGFGAGIAAAIINRTIEESRTP
ncbi:MAG TPA: nickel pincer cofactor biosynthesis protein LarB [Kiritimatiellia bacterium]|nr:nickel pincer cofactor biosynthesis protein LarB [Kiritimatiellia bacterium]HMO99957.1 nickel pincer cofactor biosynthesis protein LarB [Kiritimatiellia bacterium]HMP97033.1 nickel pincer cofactor biosynthesis protein LarB [Kiritimatiellia bacterium]